MRGRRRLFLFPWLWGMSTAGPSLRWAVKFVGLLLATAYPARGTLRAGIAATVVPGAATSVATLSASEVNRPGAFAEYLSIPAFNAFKLNDAIRDDIASILDPFGNATHTALAFNMVGEDVLITGAGPIGIMAVAIARFVGARHVVITDVNDYRLDLARKMGASRAINVSRESLDSAMKNLGMQEGFDIGLEMSGNPSAFREMLRTMHHGGSVAILGIPPEATAIDWNEVIFKGLTLKGIYGREMFETWYKMAALLQSGLNIDPIITHHFGVREFEKGFETMGSGQSGKVILDWAAL